MNSHLFTAMLASLDLDRAWHWLRWGISAAYAAALAQFWGPELGPATLYLKLVLVDFVTGVVAAGAHHRVASRIAHTGVLRKLVSGLGALALAHLLDGHLGMQGTALRSFGALLVGVETISILENLAVLGLRLPAWVWVWARKQDGNE